jgi:hypothetical protein
MPLNTSLLVDAQRYSAVKHSIICACWHMLSTGELYNDLDGDYFRKRDPERAQPNSLVTQLEALGHTRHAASGGGSLKAIFLSVRINR